MHNPKHWLYEHNQCDSICDRPKRDLSAHRSCAEWGWAWSHSVLCYSRRLWVGEWKWNARRGDAWLLLAVNEWKTTVGNVDRQRRWDWFWPSRDFDARGHAALHCLRRGSWGGPVAWQPTKIAQDVSGGRGLHRNQVARSQREWERNSPLQNIEFHAPG